MSGFSEQRQKLRQALVGAGLPPDSATLIANILGNSSQEMYHSGSVKRDTTPPDLRFVTPDLRKQRFENLDPVHNDPDHRRQQVEKSEQKKAHTPEPNVVEVLAPQQVDATFRVAPGALTDVRGDGRSAVVGVKHHVAAQPPGGHPIALLDVPGNTVVGKAPRPEIGPQDGSARFDIRENNSELIWNLQMMNRSEYDVVTGVEFVEGEGLRVSYAKIKAWDQQRRHTDIIRTVEQPVVSEIVEDKHGIYGERRRIPAFASVGIERSFLNTYRIGKFTGGWEVGATLEVDQVFPISGTKVSVVNLTHPVADTASEKYVLFAPHIRDKVTAAPSKDADNDRPHAVDGDDQRIPRPQNDVFGNPKYPPNTPPVTYYAIEIQGATECNTFSSLEGLKAEDLTDYNNTVPQALGHLPGGDPPCIKWISTPYDVITGVSITPYGLEFARTRIYALGDDGPQAPIVIPLSACPTP